MQLPISYAILSEVKEPILEPVDLLKLQNLEFKKIETSRYPIWELKDELLKNENLGVILNSANEVGVEKFLKGEIGFLDISKISLEAVEKFHNIKLKNIDDIFEVNEEVRRYCNG